MAVSGQELSECTSHLVEYAANRGLARIPQMPRIKGSVLRYLPFFVLMGVGKTMLHIPLRWSGRGTSKACYRHTAPLERKTCCGLRRITAVKNRENTPAKTPLPQSHYYEQEGESHKACVEITIMCGLLREIGDLCCIFVQFGL